MKISRGTTFNGLHERQGFLRNLVSRLEDAFNALYRDLQNPNKTTLDTEQVLVNPDGERLFSLKSDGTQEILLVDFNE